MLSEKMSNEIWNKFLEKKADKVILSNQKFKVTSKSEIKACKTLIIYANICEQFTNASPFEIKYANIII